MKQVTKNILKGLLDHEIKRLRLLENDYERGATSSSCNQIERDANRRNAKFVREKIAEAQDAKKELEGIINGAT